MLPIPSTRQFCDLIDDTTKKGREILAAIQEEAIERLGYFLKSTELFHKIAEKGAPRCLGRIQSRGR